MLVRTCSNSLQTVTLLISPSVRAVDLYSTFLSQTISSQSGYQTRQRIAYHTASVPSSSRAFHLSTHNPRRRNMSSNITSVDISSLEAEIASQTIKFNELRLSGQPLDDIKKSLSDLKKTLALARNAGKVKDKEKKTEESEISGTEKKKKDLLLLKTAKV